MTGATGALCKRQTSRRRFASLPDDPPGRLVTAPDAAEREAVLLVVEDHLMSPPAAHDAACRLDHLRHEPSDHVHGAFLLRHESTPF
jgi:hypothetical protein